MENVKKINSRQQVLNHVPQDGGAIIGVRGYLVGVIIAVNYGNIITIGRDPATCNLIMEGDFISRTHCRLSYNNGTGLYTIEDRSTNGIILPGGQITKKDRSFQLLVEHIYVSEHIVKNFYYDKIWEMESG